MANARLRSSGSASAPIGFAQEFGRNSWNGMSGGKARLREDQASIKFSRRSVGDFFPCEERVPTLSEGVAKRRGKRSGTKNAEIITTTELIAAVGQIWDYASRPLIVQTDARPNDLSTNSRVTFTDVEGGKNDLAPSLGRKTSYYCADRPLNFISVAEKLSAYEPLRDGDGNFSLSKLLKGSADMGRDSYGQHGIASLEISCELENVYGWMKRRVFFGSKSLTEEKRGKECDTASPCSQLVSDTADSNLSVVGSCRLTSLKEAKYETNIRSSIYSEYFPNPGFEADSSLAESTVSDLYHASEEALRSTDDSQHSDFDEKKSEDLTSKDFSKDEVSSPALLKPRFFLAKQEHAFAGAFAGTFVSLCLHPADTVKTVLQSCRAEQKSVFYIGKSIVAERGITGLYRGIATNISSSAPISAIYTFTYESVKGALLPHLPKEYHSLGHCVAGGCASVATSFVFTPSERIKQQMQVNGQYHNSWNALVGILQKGGFPSLYNGWGAVLCRNIPQSIIKFYTYESLKKFILSSQPPNSRPNTLQTLFCGGLAGSTAAFFTTPFDVVKTRLQTQIPGATVQYRSVSHALIEIAKSEGLKGLYSGLTPRMIMYVSQGALFFASYEMFKKMFDSEIPQPEIERVQHKENILLPSSSSTKLHNLHSS